MLGYGGMVSLGHAAYLGVASYTCILLVIAGYGHLTSAVWPFCFRPCSGVFGVLSLRAGLGFIMITLAIGQIVWGIAYQANSLTGGDNGCLFPVGQCHLASILERQKLLLFTLIVFAIAFFLPLAISRSPFGAELMGTKEQPRRCDAGAVPVCGSFNCSRSYGRLFDLDPRCAVCITICFSVRMRSGCSSRPRSC